MRVPVSRFRQAAICALVATAALRAIAEEPEAPGNSVELILGAALSPSGLEADLHHLCDRIGGRPTGSEAMSRAVDWAVERFQQVGVDRAVAESFTMPLRWEEGASSITVIAPESFAVRAVAAASSPATQEGGLEAPVLDAGWGTEGELDALEPLAEGAILLVQQEEMRTLDDLFAEYLANPPILHRAAGMGAAAVLFASTRPRGLLYRHQHTFGEIGPLPAAIVEREAAGRIRRLLQHGQEVRMRLDLPNRVGGSFQARNVVADIRGREKPDEMVLLVAHLDSWGLGTGALDNGANSVMLIDVARAIVATGLRPRRTIRFVLFSGEEQGLIGSRAYVAAHRDELDGISAVVNYDLGVGRVSGYFLGGRPELEDLLRGVLEPVRSWGVDAHPPAAFSGSDHFDFLLEGVPNLVANQDAAPYLPEYHGESDTADKVDFRELRVQTAVAAVTVWGIAELPGKLGPRLDAEGVAQLVADSALRHEMEVFSIWNDYAGGRRGRKPPEGFFEP